MRVTYDPEVDSMYITLSDKPKDRQQEINDDVILDLAADGSVVGMEILDAIKNYSSEILGFNLSFLGDLNKPVCYSDYTTEEAAQILRVNKETLLRKIRGGELKASRIGKSYRISRSELHKLIIA